MTKDRHTPLYDWHKKHGSMASFGGWSLPMHFSTIKEEHLAVRNNAGIFDVSHMGRFRFTGKDTFPILNELLPRNLMKLADGRCGYSYLLNNEGGMIDDGVTMRKSSEHAIYVCNAGPRLKCWNWMVGYIDEQKQKRKDLDIAYYDFTLESSMFALQGPKAHDIMKEMTDVEIPRGWGFFEPELAGLPVIASGTGYTGEKGFEITLIATKDDIADKATKLWKAILDVGEQYDLLPCGLGARDTLRLEAGLPLSGQDFTEKTDPFEMGLGLEPIFIDMHKDFFIGQEALLEKYPSENKDGKRTLKELTRKRVGIELQDRGIPRHGYAIQKDGEKISEISSGTLSPLTGKGIAMALLPIEYTDVGTDISVVIRGKNVPAKVVNYPFFDIDKYGRNRKE
ncbi:MAG: glycine cleavage system aminomethyltransferase GcvT [Asgard group archaeon]|nr:glycine cleavage system aminomethyltransferase GcvT [Asgard group archaeon]